MVVGTVDAVQTVVNTHQQVRHTFSTQMTESLGVPDVYRLLAARYDYGRADATIPAVPPVDVAAVEEIYALYRGDLRGLLKALDDGVRPNIAFAVTSAGDESGGVRALTAAEIRPTLQHRYAADLMALKEKTRVEQLTRWGHQAPAQPQTQEALARLWRVSQGAVSVALAFFIREGYVLTLPRHSAGAIPYVLSGTSRLIFG